ncbi:hypothetical protein [Streptomyces sp. UH6]|nr:hypothetical protein [Streptomyces sp. UH6]
MGPDDDRGADEFAMSLAGWVIGVGAPSVTVLLEAAMDRQPVA